MRLSILALSLTACGLLDGGEPAPTPSPVPVAADPVPAADERAPAPAEATVATPTDAFFLGDQEVRVARNEVFARHGRAFASEDLRAHFEAQDWYTVDPDYSDDALSADELARVQMLASFETSRDPTGLTQGAVEEMERELGAGQFTGDVNLFFVDAEHVMIMDSFDSLYEAAGVYEVAADAMRYTARGDWALVWPAGTDWRGASNGKLYRLDYDNGRVLEVHEVNPGML